MLAWAPDPQNPDLFYRTEPWLGSTALRTLKSLFEGFGSTLGLKEQ